MCFQGWDFHCDFPEKYSRVFFMTKPILWPPCWQISNFFSKASFPLRMFSDPNGQVRDRRESRASCVTAVALRAGSREWVRPEEGRDTVALMQHTLLIQIFRLRWDHLHVDRSSTVFLIHATSSMLKQMGTQICFLLLWLVYFWGSVLYI